MTAEDQRVIGRLEKAVSSLEDAVSLLGKNTREDLGKIFGRLDEMVREGCELGRQNARDIEELKQRPVAARGLWQTVATAVSAAAALTAVALTLLL